MFEYVAAALTSAAGIGVVGWVIQLGTRISVVESQHDSLIDLIESKFEEQGRRLDRIERAMNGHLRDLD